MPYADNPFLSRGLASTTLHPLGLEVSHAHGPWIELKDGSALFDAISGIGVSNFGHGHPDIQRALKAQMDKHLHTMVYGEFLQDIQVQASRALCATLPSSIQRRMARRPCVRWENRTAESIARLHQRGGRSGRKPRGQPPDPPQRQRVGRTRRPDCNIGWRRLRSGP